MTKAEILNAIKDLDTEAKKLLSHLRPDQWTKEVIPGKWTIAEQMSHLLISGFSIGSLLKQKDDFFSTFGPPSHELRTYDQLWEAYKKVNNGILIAPPQFTPNKDEALVGTEALAAWSTLLNKIYDRIVRLWEEERLDQRQLPHPAMGLMTTRELLYFKIFHTRHHYQSITDWINRLSDKQ